MTHRCVWEFAHCRLWNCPRLNKYQLPLQKPCGRKEPLPATSQLAICNDAGTPRWLFLYLVNIPCIIVESLFSHLFSQKWNKLPTCTDLCNNSVSVGCDWASQRRSRLRKMGKKFIRFRQQLFMQTLDICPLPSPSVVGLFTRVKRASQTSTLLLA